MSDIKTKIEVALLFGGESSEHEVSIKSARSVYNAIDKEKYDIRLIYIDKFGKWWLTNDIEQTNEQSLQITPVLGSKSFIILGTGEKISPNVILPIIHGENCEDGCLQGLAKLTHIPIAGCGVSASAVCMDKVLTKKILESENIKVVPYVINSIYEETPSFDYLSNILGDTIFIKPSGCGSSVGVSKVINDEQLAKAILEARKFDNKILIEKAIVGRELEVAIIGSGDKSRASVIGEIIPDRDFYDFDSKYSSISQSQSIIPANLSDDQSKTIREIALRAYRLIGCSGFVRVDFFLSNEGDIYLNEINTIPGFTDISMFPKLWSASGLTYDKLIDEIINLTFN